MLGRATIAQNVPAGPKAARNPLRAILPKLLAVPTGVFLIVFFILPVLGILGPSLMSPDGQVSLENYGRVLETPVYLQVLLNTFKISSLVALLCVVVAYPMALYVSSSNHSATSLIMVIILIPFWTSQLVRVFAWMVIFGRNGVINDTLIRFGLTTESIEILYSLPAVTVAMVHACIPIAVLSIASAMGNIDRRLEQAALTLGASRAHAFWQVYFPRSFPGVASAYLITMIICLGIFTHPALLGSPREMMVAQLIIFQVQELLNWSFAGAIAVYLLLGTTVLLIVFDLLLGVTPLSGGTATADDRDKRSSRLRRRMGLGALSGIATVFDAIGRVFGRLLPGRWRGPAREGRILPTLAWLGILFAAVPTFVLVPVSFTDSTALQWPPSGFSLRWYAQVLESPEWREAAIRSVVVALGTSVCALTLGIPAAVAIDRGIGKAARPFMLLVMLPMIVPNIIVSLALFYFYSRIGLIGTTAGLIVSHTIFALPYVVITVRTALRNLSPHFVPAALTLGATPLTAFRTVTLPLIKTGLMTSALFAFVISFDELAVTMFLTGGSSVTLPIKLWTESRAYFSPLLASASVLLLLFVLTIIIAATSLQKRANSPTRKRKNVEH